MGKSLSKQNAADELYAFIKLLMQYHALHTRKHRTRQINPQNYIVHQFEVSYYIWLHI